jgi:hypothetical protein
MSKTRNLSDLLDANGDVKSTALDNVPASHVVNDTTPQLGGDLDLNSNDITGTGNINITGTVTSDGLTVDGNASLTTSGANGLVINQRTDNAGNSANIFLSDSSGTVGIQSSSGALRFNTGATVGSASGTERMRINSSGNVGIGTSSPNQKLTVAGNIEIYRDDADGYIWFHDFGTRSWALGHDVTNGAFVINSNSDLTANNRFAIATNGNVGIGTSSPAQILQATDVDGTGFVGIRTQNNNVNVGLAGIEFSSDTTYSKAAIAQVRENANGNGPLLFFVDSATDAANWSTGDEKMRIDSSGNLFVNKTADSVSSDGFQFLGGSNNYLAVTRDGGNPLFLNRRTSDGDIIQLRKDNSVVGIIGSLSGNAMYVNAPNDGGGGFLFSDNSSTIYPTRRTSGTVSLSDDTNDLGAAVWRFDDIYATNGTIQTSDQNEKQSIQSLTASEMAVAQRISKLFKTFKWNSSVEEKGDSARTHTGIIAQDVQQAFADEGLDASNYALFISGTWWEKEISVDAVAEELDEEGNVVVEGKDAYTYIDTKEEATEGYTERTRLGIRYPELLSFVSSAFEQRLTNIETRLTALET